MATTDMLTKIQHSLSARLIVLFICAGAVLLLLVGSILGKGFSRHFQSSTQPFIVHYIQLMHHQLGSPPDFAQAKSITLNTPVDIHVIGIATSWSTSEKEFNPDLLIESNSNDELDTSSGFRIKRINQNLILQTREGDFDIYFEIHSSDNSLRGERLSIFVLFSIIGILILIYYATRSIFSPIDDINQGVKQFGEGNFVHKISKRRNDQLGDLTDSVNQMAQDINQMLEAKRQFLLGVSHELRSPLTRCKVNLALMQDSPGKKEINHEIETMDELINELLESERLNSPHRVIQPESVEISHLIHELISSEFTKDEIKTSLEQVDAEVDISRFKLLIRNLLQNAIKYSRQGKPPRISLVKKSKHFIISVQDHGAGISAQHIPFLTEPFYRADPTRRRITGGYGLGLYLCRMIVEAHSGQITITSEQGKGTHISCRFPLQTLETNLSGAL